MRTERGERRFYHALSALLFAALCAWSAAALFGGLDAADEPAPTAEASAVPCGRLRGVLLRREAMFPAGSFPGAEEGARLSAIQTGTESALYFTGCDGWEFLTPEELEKLTPEKLEALLDMGAAEGDAEAARLVYGFAVLLAALYEGETPPMPGPVRLRLEGIGELRARLLSVTADALGRKMLVMRLAEFPEELYRVRFVTGEVF